MTKRRFRRTFAAVLAGMMSLSMLTGCAEGAFSYGQGLEALDDKKDPDDEEPFPLDGDDEGGGSSSSSKPNVTYADEENQEFEDWIKENFVDSVTGDTLSYNYAFIDGSAYGAEAPEVATFGDCDMSAEAWEDSKKESEDYYNELIAFEDAELTEKERFVYECLKEEADYQMHFYDNIYFYEPFAPGRGYAANLPTNFTEFRFDDKKDIEDYIALENDTPYMFEKALEFEYDKSEAGFFVSDATADEIIGQCDDFTEETEDHFMIQVFDSKIDELDWLTDDEKAAYKEQNKDAVINSMIPAYEDVKATFEELKGTGTNDKSLYYYDGGKEYYADYIFPKYCGSTKTVDEEISAMEMEYTNLMTQLSAVYYSNSDAYDEFCTRYYDEDSLFGDPDEQPTADEISAMIESMETDCMSEFPDIGKIEFRAEYLSKPMETIMDGTLAYYMSPAYDDPSGNSIKVNGADTSGVWPTLAHEGCPGHMYQNTYFMSTDPSLARIDAGNLGYMEGWAQYGMYKAVQYYDFEDTDSDKVFADLYCILTKMGYLLYGRIDVGVNYEGWDEEKVAEEMEEMGYGSDHAGEMMQTVIDDPGLYLSYSIGYMEMQELHDNAEDELGDNFDEVEFNRCILEAGPCQFVNLKSEVDKFIDENK